LPTWRMIAIATIRRVRCRVASTPRSGCSGRLWFRGLHRRPRLPDWFTATVHDAHFLRTAPFYSRTDNAVADAHPIHELTPEAAPLADRNDQALRPIERDARQSLCRRRKGHRKRESNQPHHRRSPVRRWRAADDHRPVPDVLI